MRRERRKPTRREWTKITTRRPVVRQVPPPSKDNTSENALPEELSFALAKIRYARAVIRESKGEKPDEVLEALRELGDG